MKIVIVESLSFAPEIKENELVLTWKGYFQSKSTISILRHVDLNGEKFRDAYTAFVHDLGESIFSGKRLVEHFKIQDDFSLWWMSLLAEKSPYKSPRILDCFRLMALEEKIQKHGGRIVELHMDDKCIALAIRDLCRSLGKEFIWKRSYRKEEGYSLRKAFALLPHPLQGFIYGCRYLLGRWKFRRNSSLPWNQGPRTAFFVSNFFNLDIKKAKEKKFHARQWESFPDFLSKQGIKNNFVHHFLYSPDIPNTKTAFDLIELINQNDKGDVHRILDNLLNLKILRDVMFEWGRGLLRSLKLARIEQHFKLKNTHISFWHLLKDDWKSSLVGSASMNNILWVGLFNELMRSIPHQEIGFYLCENQGWERAFLSAWKKNGHGVIVAVPHTTLRFWDIRYYFDKRSLNQQGPFALPLPDKIAVNGQVAWDLLLDSGVSEKDMVKVEALRFQYLNKFSIPVRKQQEDLIFKVLILGDFTAVRTAKMLKLFKEVLDLKNLKVSLTLKPHPACILNTEDYAGIDLAITNEPLVDIIYKYNAAFSSNTTSAALDAYIAGLHIVVFLDENDFNFSPLKGCDGVCFVSDANELAESLISKTHNNITPNHNFFWLDDNLTLWKRFLASTGLLK